MKVCFETFGCRLNRAEALQMEADYVADGWDVTTRHDEADVIVVRGCSVTQRAQHDCEKLIEHLKRKYPAKHILTTGCLKEKKNSATGLTRIFSPSAAKMRTLPRESESVPTRTARAYLKVQDGCNASCSFCIVPSFRGRSVSVPFQDVLAKAARFIDAGYREIVVTGCNLSHYLSDGKRLPELMDALANLSPMCRVRLGSLEPGVVALAVVDVLAAHENCCRFLHMPVQSGSDGILAAMKRPYKIRDVNELVAKVTRLLPNIGLGCDLITGFPGETELDFLATKTLLERLPFTKAHIFPYSERPGTPAAHLPLAIDRSVRHARAHQLAAIADNARVRFLQRFKGRTVQVLIEDEKHAVGWTSEYAWCHIRDTAKTPVTRKEIVEVVVRDISGHTLLA